MPATRRRRPPKPPTTPARTATTDPLTLAGELIVTIDAKLQAIIADAMAAWRTSKADSPGNPAYLDVALTAMDLRARLHGLYSPVRYEVSGPGGEALQVICS